MIKNLMYIANGLILSGYIGYFLLIVFNKNKKITNSNGFNVTKNILNEYDRINIIENKDYFTIYNLKRKVIKIASNCYYGNSLSNIAIPLIEAGISITDNNKNKFINMLRKITSNLKILYILPIIAILLNDNSYGIMDAKIGIVLLVLFSFISYMLINIKSEAILWLSNNFKKIKDISKDNYLKIDNFINKIILFDKFIFIGELVMIIRFVAILLQFN